jgi:hypothetical protein
MSTRIFIFTLTLATLAAIGATIGACASDAGPACDNGAQDGTETGVDCGGGCGLCPAAACTENAACASRLCVADVCTAPTCTDGVRNGAEQGVDCGGECVECQPSGADVFGADATDATTDPPGACPAHDEAEALRAVAQCQLNCEWAIGRYQRCLRDCDDLHALGLPDECRTCYSDWAVCQFVNCIGACATNPEFDGCKQCIAEECDPTFDACR